ncbi:hypothetical protein CDG81_10830 [Actinopolyspora erythraea]|uniref:Uncharacterized protein n=1 Tax=Actinopolyspora erythraea TaxID=414996 RepID=A0A099D5L2_9ACTN|nr:hypothetical protein [Actinopolyspora erythraea]ASU78690.1 hypothetical protein CDG81_10830 [Actinopolyspora erythraea]KGI81443.1 hypothetical protein IL38_10875 [Actinopolyspora erythraea]
MYRDSELVVGAVGINCASTVFNPAVTVIEARESLGNDRNRVLADSRSARRIRFSRTSASNASRVSSVARWVSTRTTATSVAVFRAGLSP